MVKKTVVKTKPSKTIGSGKGDKPPGKAAKKLTDREKVNKYLNCVRMKETEHFRESSSGLN